MTQGKDKETTSNDDPDFDITAPTITYVQDHAEIDVDDKNIILNEKK